MIALAREAGEIALRHFGTALEISEKAKGEPVTNADHAIDGFIRDHLAKVRPEDGWLSEETADHPRRLDKRRVWIVDPIDGTRAFMKAKPDFAIAIALIEDGRPVLAALNAPAHGEFYWAEAGAGAHLNGQRISASAATELDGCRMLAPKAMFGHPAWARPWPEMRVETRSSIAYRVALVADGRFDAAITLAPKNEWDLAAADLILREAGGRMATHVGAAMTYNQPEPRLRSMVAAAPGLIDAILARTRQVATD